GQQFAYQALLPADAREANGPRLGFPGRPRIGRKVPPMLDLMGERHDSLDDLRKPNIAPFRGIELKGREVLDENNVPSFPRIRLPKHGIPAFRGFSPLGEPTMEFRGR